MEFITTGNRIAVENFDIGKIYTITWETGNYKSLACTGKGTDFVMFQDQEPDLLFCLTMDSAISVSSIDEGGGGSGTNNYNELENKPSINGFVLVGNKTGAELGLASQSDLEDYATNASVVAGLATKQDALSSSQLAAVNSGITSALVTQIGTNTSAIAGKQDALSSSQLQAVNSGITSALVTQIGTNTSAIAGKQDALSSSQLSAVNSGITSSLVTQIGTNENNILTANAELIELVDNGAKNVINNTLTNGSTSSQVTATVDSDLKVTLSGTTPSNADASFAISSNKSISGGTYIGSGCPSGGATDKYRIDYIINDGTVYRDTGNGVEFTINDGDVIRSQIVIYRGNTAPSAAFAPMVCTKAAWDVSQKYVPYAPTNEELYEMIKALQS